MFQISARVVSVRLGHSVRAGQHSGGERVQPMLCRNRLNLLFTASDEDWIEKDGAWRMVG